VKTNIAPAEDARSHRTPRKTRPEKFATPEGTGCHVVAKFHDFTSNAGRANAAGVTLRIRARVRSRSKNLSENFAEFNRHGCAGR